MPRTRASSSPPVADVEAARGLRADLLDAGYTVDHLGEVLGARAAAALHREQPLPADLATAGSGDPAAVLTCLFVLARPVGTTVVDAALPRTGSAGLLRLGLADRASDSGMLRATCDLRPYGDERHTWWIASDLSEAVTEGPLPTDHVLGIGGASTTLSSWTPRPPVGRALDLGTGGGIQALHLSTHAASVIATDLSGRALAYSSFTAALNGLALDLRRGSLLEPVAGETFDLIVSNPPFVITPRTQDVPVYEYRDGGAPGDTLMAGLVRGLAAHLRPGGIAQLLANWELREGEDWQDRVGGWVSGLDLDAWVVQREVQDVAEYAETWVRDGGHRPGTAEFDRLYAAWLADFESRGVASVGFGVVTLQRPTAGRQPWRDLMDVRVPVASPMGPSVLAGLRARTWLTEHADEVLDVAWQVAEDVTEERIGRPGAEGPQVIQLRQGGGLRRVVQLDTLSAGVVGACDGELTARQLCAGLAVLTEAPADEVEAAVLPTLRELVKDGLMR